MGEMGRKGKKTAKVNWTTLARFEARKRGELAARDREEVAGCCLGTDSGPRA